MAERDVTYSVIMPIYLVNQDHEEVIWETIHSVLSNDEDFEFIIVNDGSKLDTKKFHKFCDVFVDRKKNKGIAPSWNDGLRMARGEYLAVINDDIVVPKGWLGDTVKCFEEFIDVGVAAPRVQHLPDPESGMEIKKSWFPGSCFMLSRDTIDKVGYFDEQFVPFNCEDLDYWIRVTNAGLHMARNYDVYVGHKEGDVLHDLDYKNVDNENVSRLIAKYGQDPRGPFYT
jgi:GT2 family glycosyltransferase